MAGTTFTWQSSGFNEIIKEYNSLGDAQKKLDSLVRQLAKAFEAQGSTRQDSILGARELAKANGLTADSIKNLIARQNELKQGGEAIDALVRRQLATQAEATKNYQAQEKAVQSLGFTLKGNVESFTALNTAFNNNSVEAKKAVDAYQQLRNNGASLAQTQQVLASQLGVSESQFKVLNTELNKSQANITQAQQSLVAFGVAVSASVGAAFASGVKQYTDFQRVIQQIGVISDATGTPALKNLEGTIKQLSLATTKSPQEIAEVTKELVKAGFTADEASVALNGIVKGSEATGESLSVVGDVIAKTIRQFNLTAADSTRIADVLTKTANSTNTDVTGLGESLKFVGTAANQSGQKVEDVVAVLGLLGDAGLQGGQGGRNLAQALARVNIASAELPPELDGVVKGSKKMREAFSLLKADIRTADNQLKPLPDVLKILKGSLEGFNAGEKAVLLKAIFGDEGGRAIGAALNRSVEDIDRVASAANNAFGEVNKQSQALTQGLPGAFDLFNSSTQLLSQTLGETLAPALEAVLRSATALINGFLGLPTPVQALVIGTGALVGVLAAATAAIAAFNLAANAGVLSSGLFAVQLVASTVALTAETASLVIAAVAAGNFSAANAVLATSLGGVQAALTPVLASLLAALPVIVAIAAAVAAVSFVAFIKDSEDVSNAMDALANNTSNSINEFGVIAGKIRSFNQEVKNNGELTAEQTRQAQGYIKIGKDKIKSLEDEANALRAIKTSDEDRKKAIEANINAIETQKETLGRMVGALENNIAASKAKQGADARANDETVKGSAASEKRTKALKDEATALKEAAEADKIKAQNAFDDKERGISRKQEDQKTARKETEDTQVKAVAEKNAKIEQDIKDKYSAQIKEKEAANQEVIQSKQKEFETNVLGPLKQKQQAELQAVQGAFEKSQQAQKASFERGLREETAKFNQEQNQKKREFEKQLKEEEKAFNKQLSEEQKQVDRKVQLSTAAPEDRAKLVQDFAKQDQEAKLREQLEAPLQAKKQAFEEQQAAKKEEFEKKQSDAKLAFEDQINAKKQAFEAQQQEAKVAFETNVLGPLKQKQEEEINAKKKEFEDTVIKPLKQQQEQELTNIRKQQENEIATAKKAAEAETNALKKKFAEEERALDRKYEDEKIARKRQFDEEQRQKQQETEDKIAALKKESDGKQEDAAKQQLDAANKQLEAAQLQANKPGGSPASPTRPERSGRFMGGSVVGGTPYVVGEREPEVFVPGVSGTILNQQQIRDNLDRLLMGANNYAVPVGAFEQKSSDLNLLIKEVERLTKIVENRESKIEIYPQWNPENDSDNDRNLRLIRSAIRANL